MHAVADSSVGKESMRLMVFEAKMPKLAETMEEGTIVRWLKTEGEWVEKGQPLLEVEMEKATMEVPSPATGYLRRVLFQEGETVPVTTVIAYIADSMDVEVPESKPVPENTDTERGSATTGPNMQSYEDTREGPTLRPPTPGRSTDAEDSASRSGEWVKASPAARRLAREHGIDLRLIPGTGPGGRVVETDVQAFLEDKGSQFPSKHNDMVRAVKMSQMRKTIASRLAESKRVIPHFYVSIEADMSESVRLREELGSKTQSEPGLQHRPSASGDVNGASLLPRVSYNDMIVKAVGRALRKHLDMNARLCGDVITVLDEVNVGIAVNVEGGLVVPVIRDADKKTVWEIADESKVLINKARTGMLSREDCSGGTFTVTNLGMLGVDSFAAIINPPEVGILAVGKISLKPVARNDQIALGHVVTLTLSADHRVVDGVSAGSFLKTVKAYLEEPRRYIFGDSD